MTQQAAFEFLKKNIDPPEDSRVFLIHYNDTLWWLRLGSKTAFPCATVDRNEQFKEPHASDLYGEDMRLFWLPSWETNLATQMAAELFYFTVEWTKVDSNGKDRQNLPVCYHNGPLETFLGPNSSTYQEYLRLINEPPTAEEIATMAE